MRTHFGQHGPDCFGCKLGTLQFGPASEEQRAALQERLGTENNLFGKDRDAYYRLRMNGVQPKSIRHAHQLETMASTEREITEGRIISKQAWREAGSMVEDAEAIVKACELKPNSDLAKELGEKVRAEATSA